MSNEIKSGFIAIVGRANAGKSTLLNSFVEQKVSIVSPKPQTTRNKILGIWTTDDVQMCFVDTPGVLKPSNRLGEFMVKSIDNAVKDVDCILAVIDGHKGIGEGDMAIVERFRNAAVPLVVAITKTDISQPERLMPELAKLNGLEGIDSVWAVSARKGNNVRELRDYLKKFLNDNVAYFDSDDVTDKSERFMVCELIREKILLSLSEEVPHGTAVQVDRMKYDEDRKTVDIDATIIVEKASHKPIIIGKNGSMLKGIGIHARASIEKMLNAHVYLSLWIKVKEDWRNSEYIMRESGYDKNENL